MPDPAWSRASLRLRTTATAVLVVTVVMVAGAVVLVALVRDSLRDGLETTAEQRAVVLAEQVRTSGIPVPRGFPEGDDDADDDLLWQLRGPGGAVLAASEPLDRPLPTEDADEVRIDEEGGRHLVVTEEAEVDGEEVVVAVAASLDDVEEQTTALVTTLALGFPVVLLLVGGTTWLATARALAPVERIRREVERITGDRLDRRVSEPASHDEVHRLARTMNQMLGRLEHSRDRQRQFVADASHELRSPLASIRQTAEVARAHPGALPEGELVETVLEESARMQRLVEQLLLLTRADQGTLVRAPQDVDLDDIALAEARRVRRTGLTVDTAGVGPGRVRGDAVALAQVVRNVVDNAARHAETTVAVSVRRSDGAVELVVEDDGPGVPAEHRERVFERFIRLDEARARDAGGSGLGLAIVRETVAAHGGSVRVCSSALGGASLVVRLPAGPEPAA